MNADTENGPPQVEDFLNGYSRIGLCSGSEDVALGAVGRSLMKLQEGLKRPKTEGEAHFVEVCNGNAEPDTIIEKVWLKRIEAYKRSEQSSVGNQLEGEA